MKDYRYRKVTKTDENKFIDPPQCATFYCRISLADPDPGIIATSRIFHYTIDHVKPVADAYSTVIISNWVMLTSGRGCIALENDKQLTMCGKLTNATTTLDHSRFADLSTPFGLQVMLNDVQGMENCSFPVIQHFQFR